MELRSRERLRRRPKLLTALLARLLRSFDAADLLRMMSESSIEMNIFHHNLLLSRSLARRLGCPSFLPL